MLITLIKSKLGINEAVCEKFIALVIWRSRKEQKKIIVTNICKVRKQNSRQLGIGIITCYLIKLS
jgi:hypothetical protein